MTNENARNRPRYPLDRRCVRTPAPNGITPVPLIQNGMNELPGEVCVTPEYNVTPPRNPFGSAFR
ncbi:MAG: hypothetical protein ACLR5G_06560 [Eubacteriales bacterium]